MTYSVITKLTLLLLTALSAQICMSPPNPPPKDQEIAETKSLKERFILSLAFGQKCITWVAILCDAVATISVSHWQTSTMHYMCPRPPVLSTALWTIHPIAVTGALGAAAGALGRLWCYNALGRLFTFQVSIRQQHELITGGPYAWARHPSYSALFLVVLGEMAVLCSPGMWLVECGTWRGTGPVVLMLWLLSSTLLVTALANRLTTEEEALRKAFGHHWDEYAEKVPYQLLPGLF